MVDAHGSPVTVALIPLRGGSKSIPLKNIKPLAGRPLAYWTIKAALDTKKIDRVFVASDSKEILEKLEARRVQARADHGRDAADARERRRAQALRTDRSQSRKRD